MTTLSEQVKNLEEELYLEKTWAEGEIMWLSDQLNEAEAEAHLWKERAMILEEAIREHKPWWRYIFS